MFALYTMSVLKKLNHTVEYKKELPKNFEVYDIFIIVSSIVCCETEYDFIKRLSVLKKKIKPEKTSACIL